MKKLISSIIARIVGFPRRCREAKHVLTTREREVFLKSGQVIRGVPIGLVLDVGVQKLMIPLDQIVTTKVPKQ